MSKSSHYRQLEAGLAGLIRPIKFSAEINLRLERITHLLDLLGNPQREFESIHVGGTSGKGSTSAMIAAILTEGGYKTGLHTSPHLQVLNERHQIDGEMAETSDLWALFQEMLPAIEQVGQALPQFGKPSYFEAQFALSCLWFERQMVDVAVVEVGLGGTLDATNILQAAVAVLTNVGLDHTEILGDTIEEIISDKAGIIKPGQFVITGVTQPSALEIVQERCLEQGAALAVVRGLGDGEWNIGLKGAFQQQNAACAIAAAQTFAEGTLSKDALEKGVRGVQFPGRMEVMQTEPAVILDGAHNPDKMRFSAEFPAQLNKPTTLIFALKTGKDLEAVLREALLPHVEKVIATQFVLEGLWEAVSAEKIAQTIQTISPNLPIIIEPDPLAAIERALTEASPDDLIWVTGSLYLIGNIRNHWFPKE